MKKMLKRGLAISFIFAMLCFMVVANAALPTEPEIQPMYTFIDTVRCNLSISGSTANMSGYVSADADKCQIKLSLQIREEDGGWRSVASFTEAEESSSMSSSHSYSVDPGEEYRLKATFKVWNGDSTESTTKYDS